MTGKRHFKRETEKSGVAFEGEAETKTPPTWGGVYPGQNDLIAWRMPEPEPKRALLRPTLA